MSQHKPVVPLILDEQICFAIYSTSLAMTRAYKPVLRRLGLTYSQYLVMLVLWEGDNLTVRDIATRLRLDSATVTPLLQRLETRGHVNRERSDNDERLVVITLTEQGRALKRSARDIPVAICSATQLPQEFLAALRDDLTHLRTSLDELNVKIN